jgi:hypothetical protein
VSVLREPCPRVRWCGSQDPGRSGGGGIAARNARQDSTTRNYLEEVRAVNDDEVFWGLAMGRDRRKLVYVAGIIKMSQKNYLSPR